MKHKRLKNIKKNEWIKAKKQKENNLKKIDNKLSGYFQNLTTRMSN